jgi:hypothetical protein
VIFILPETKGISLERMEKIFGEVNFVEAGERETTEEKIEAIVYSAAHGDGHIHDQDHGQIKREEAFMRTRLGGTDVQLERKELV